MTKWTATTSEILLGVGGLIVTGASSDPMTYIPAAAVLGGAVYVARRSERVRLMAEGTPAAHLLLTEVAGELPAKRDAKPVQSAKKATGRWFDDLVDRISAQPEVRTSTLEEVGPKPVVEKPKAQDPRDDGLLDRAETPDTQIGAMRRLPRSVLLGSLQPYPEASTSVPLGVNYRGEAVWADFASDLLHVGVYGTSGSGKDNLLRIWFALLTKRNSSEALQFAFLDGKGDWLTPDLAGLAHMWVAPAGGYGERGKQAILTAIEAIDKEAERRQELIFGAGFRSREAYNRAHPDRALPLLIVVASDVMGSIAGKVEELLAALVSKARALGIRVVASMQTPTGKGMDWRMNLSTVMAGAMLDGTQDGPALGVREVRELPFRPSKIPPPPKERGVFVVKVRGAFTLLRTPIFLADQYENEERFNSIVASLPAASRAQLPARSRVLVLADEGPNQPEEEDDLLSALLASVPTVPTSALASAEVSTVSRGTGQDTAPSGVPTEAQIAIQYAIYLRAVRALGMPKTDVVLPEDLPMDIRSVGIRKLLTTEGSKNAVARRLGGSKTTAYRLINRALGLVENDK